MVDQLIPKAINVQLPGYYGVFYMDAGVQAAIKQLETSAQVMQDAGNEQAYYGLIEAITAFKAMRVTLSEVKAENNQELAHLQQEEMMKQQNVAGANGTAQFGTVLEDDPDDTGKGPMKDS